MNERNPEKAREKSASPDAAHGAEPTNAAPRFEIEGHDEIAPNPGGHFFSEPAREPPKQPYEKIRKKAAQGGTRPFEFDREPAPHETAAAPSANPPAPSPPSSTPAQSFDLETVAREPRNAASAEEETILRPAARPRRPSLALRLFWGCLPLLLFAAGYAAVAFCQTNAVGHAWDEAYMFEPAAGAAAWMRAAVAGEPVFGDEAILRYWSAIPEHAAVPKFIAGLGLIVFPQHGRELWAMRWPMGIVFGLTLVLIYLLGRRVWGPAPGLLAALMYFAMPRMFGQALLVTYETPLVFFTLLTVFCFLRGLDSGFWSLMTGVAFGLLAATKINGLFVPIALVLWAHVYARPRYLNNLFCMLVVAPLVMVAAWPLLWHETIIRFMRYLEYFLRHEQIGIWYLGQRWGFDARHAPWHYPLVITAVTTPLLTLGLALWGAGTTLANPRRRPVSMLFLAICAMMFLIASIPSTPKFDGVRLFTPAFPFLALLGGAGAWSLASLLAGPLSMPFRHDAVRRRKIIARLEAALGLAIVLNGAHAIALYHPFTLSYFNAIEGGIEGAWASKDFETTYWGEAINDGVVAELNRLPDGASVKPLACHALSLMNLQRWGMLNPTLRIDGEPPFDAHVMLNRRGLFGQVERMLFDERRLGEMRLDDSRARIFYKFGVPMAGVFWTGQGPSPLTPPAQRSEP